MTTPLAYFSERFGRSRRDGKTVVIVIVILAVSLFLMVACGGILVALLLPAVQQARHAARRMQSQNNMKQIGLALHNYHDTYGTFPPAYIPDEDGKPMHSWRVLILPFVEESYLYDQYDFDKPWDHSDNMAVTAQLPSVYRSPFLETADSAQGLTPYVAISAPDTALGETEGAQLREIVDRHSGTMMLLENFAQPVYWAEPTDVSPDQILANYNRMAKNPQMGINVLMADISVHFITEQTQTSSLEGGFYINDGHTFGP
jgi:hypothetical protein